MEEILTDYEQRQMEKPDWFSLTEAGIRERARWIANDQWLSIRTIRQDWRREYPLVAEAMQHTDDLYYALYWIIVMYR